VFNSIVDILVIVEVEFMFAMDIDEEKVLGALNSPGSAYLLYDFPTGVIYRCIFY